MSTSTVYEWVIEEIDEHGDIVNVEHWDTRAQAESRVAGETGRRDIGLVRDVICEMDGVIDRAWAYLQADGTLPEYFSDSGGGETRHKVPTRFRKEAK